MRKFLAVILLLSACGGGTSATPATSLNGEQSKSAQQILNDAHYSLQVADRIKIDVNYSYSGGSVNFVAQLDLDNGSVHMVGNGYGGHYEAVRADGRVYLMGDAKFYESTNHPELESFAGQWIVTPAGSQLDSGVSSLVDRGNFADCMLGQTHGTLTVTGQTVVNGQAVIGVRDAGDAQGSAPETIYVSLSNAPYPIALRQTGPASDSAVQNLACQLGGSSARSGSIDFSDFNKPFGVSVPAGAVDVSFLGTPPA